MDMDKETLKKIIETHTDVKYILKSLEEGKIIFKEHDERIRMLEQQQQFMKGKLAIIILAFGGILTLLFNLFLWGYSKFKHILS